MSDVDLSEFEALSNPNKRTCRVGKARAALSAKERAQLDAACAADRGEIGAGAVVKWLDRRGHTASAPGVTAHRDRKCSCYAEG